jgi:hypothetical protein
MEINMSCYNKEQLENMLFSIVDELNLSESAIEKHGQEGTDVSKLVRLVLDEKDAKIRKLEKRLEEAEAKIRWIPVTEALPGKGVDVIAIISCNDGSAFAQTELFDGSIWSCEKDHGFEVTHWIAIPAIPELPEGEK